MRFSWFKFNASSLLIWSVGLMSAGFLGSALMDLGRYLLLEGRSEASVYRWKVIEKSSSEFALRASYRFDCQGKTYKGRTIFSKPYHLNRMSAEKQIQKFSTEQWQVWYQPSHPQRSSLQKIFPTKKCLYALMTLGVFLYFLYVVRYKVQFSKSL